MKTTLLKNLKTNLYQIETILKTKTLKELLEEKNIDTVLFF